MQRKIVNFSTKKGRQIQSVLINLAGILVTFHKINGFHGEINTYKMG